MLQELPSAVRKQFIQTTQPYIRGEGFMVFPDPRKAEDVADLAMSIGIQPVVYIHSDVDSAVQQEVIEQFGNAELALLVMTPDVYENLGLGDDGGVFIDHFVEV